MTVPSSVPDRLGSRYEVQQLLGQGGMADVYVARDTVLERRVAVKLLRDAANLARFRAEADALARLAHPGLVTILDAGISDERPWLVMELVDGVSLADCCTGVALAPERVAAMGRQLAEALAYVHASGFIHRDVKPGNVLLAKDDRVLLADFGIARLVEGAPTVTIVGHTVGTAAYLAPEQVRGDALRPPVDVYSLGLVLLEALTGRRAYPGPAGEAAFARLTRGPDVPATLPAAWRWLLRAMTDPVPGARPSAADVARALHELSGGRAAADTTVAGTTLAVRPRPPKTPLLAPLPTRPLTVAQPATPRPAEPRSGRHAGRAVWAAVVLLAVGALVALFTSTGIGDPGAASANEPGGVPGKVTTDLQRLHDAADHHHAHGDGDDGDGD